MLKVLLKQLRQLDKSVDSVNFHVKFGDNGQAVSTGLYALFCLHQNGFQKDGEGELILKEFTDLLCRHALQKDEFIADIPATILVQVLCLWGFEVPPWLMEVYELIKAGERGVFCDTKTNDVHTDRVTWKNMFGPASRMEDHVLSILQKEMPDVQLQQNEYVDGFELDLYFPEFKLNLEIDGKTHSLPTKIRRDTMRDKYLLDHHGIITWRIHHAKTLNEAACQALRLLKSHMANMKAGQRSMEGGDDAGGGGSEGGGRAELVALIRRLKDENEQLQVEIHDSEQKKEVVSSMVA